MKKEKKELEVVVYGEIDLRKVPKEIFDAFIAALRKIYVMRKKREIINRDNV